MISIEKKETVIVVCAPQYEPIECDRHLADTFIASIAAAGIVQSQTLS